MYLIYFFWYCFHHSLPFLQYVFEKYIISWKLKTQDSTQILEAWALKIDSQFLKVLRVKYWSIKFWFDFANLHLTGIVRPLLYNLSPFGLGFYWLKSRESIVIVASRRGGHPFTRCQRFPSHSVADIHYLCGLLRGYFSIYCTWSVSRYSICTETVM